MAGPSLHKIRSWLLSPCISNGHVAFDSVTRGRCAAAPYPVNMVRPVVCGVQLHESHKFAVFKGMWFCVVCGKIGGNTVIKLREVCTRGASMWGKRMLRALAEGLLPNGVSHWPEDALRKSAFVLW